MTEEEERLMKKGLVGKYRIKRLTNLTRQSIDAFRLINHLCAITCERLQLVCLPPFVIS